MPQLASDVFHTIPGKDYLALYPGSKVRWQDVVGLLEFQKNDVSKAAEVPLASVRYDDRIPSELAERIREWAVLLNLVAEYFEGDRKKTVLWFSVRNPMLGNVAPRDMVRLGRYKRLMQFIVSALAENRR